MAIKSNPVKQIIRRSLQHLAANFGRHTHSHASPQLLILMYHRILPCDDARALLEEPGMMVTPDSFRMHINILKENFELIQLSDWITRKKSGDSMPNHACAITFDDGWADNYEFAFPILKESKTPATIFLVSNMVGTNKKFWPERLAQIVSTITQDHPSQYSNPELDWVMSLVKRYNLSTRPPSPDELSELIASTKLLSDAEINLRIDKIEHALNLSPSNGKPSILNWQQISEMNESGLVELGSHSCNHTRLYKPVDLQTLENEIIMSKQQIENIAKCDVKTFCFPNGDYTPEALELVRENYEGCVSTSTGWNSVSSDSHLLHRIAIHDDIANDKAEFLARISGWM